MLLTLIKKYISILCLFNYINYVRTFNGDGTFYGGDATLDGTNSCLLQPNFNSIINTVAINREQYENGASCGKCVSVNLELDSNGNPIGLGVKPLPFHIIATVNNECPECKFGDLDFGYINNGESYDGRWSIQWEWVDCHNYYRKYNNSNHNRIGNKNLRYVK